MKDYINQIICGDHIEVLGRFDADSIDLTVTSPPYDNLRDYEGYSFDFKKLGHELYRIIKPGGVVVWVVGDSTINGSETGSSFKQALYFKEIGFNLHDTMIYKSHKPPLTHNRYEQEFEYMFVFSKGKPITFNPSKRKNIYAGCSNKSSKYRHDGKETKDMHTPGYTAEVSISGNVWFYITGMNKTTQDKEAYQHPAIFPENLARDHILSWSNEGDVVLDPMCGSGTTCKMAYRYKRKFIGIDISEKYCRIAQQRMKDEMSQLTLF